MKRVMSLTLLFTIFFVFTGHIKPGSAESLSDLQSSISEKKGQLTDLRNKLATYQKALIAEQKQAISLANEVSILQNQIATSEIQLAAMETEIEQLNLEMQVYDAQREGTTTRLASDRVLLGSLMRELAAEEGQGRLVALLSRPSISGFFLQLGGLGTLEQKLTSTLDDLSNLKVSIETMRTEVATRQNSITDLRTKLSAKHDELANQEDAKAYLLTAARNSEIVFRSLISELRAEDLAVTNQLESLKSSLTDKLGSLNANPEFGGLFSWPLAHVTSISARFHDPTYPFRRLFEHSGIDLPSPVGTPVLATASGIVVSRKAGTLYGNYLVVIHQNGYATLYAHLSKMLVSPDQVVQRGDVIGFSGGARGEKGSGDSTGPHLHFEVRANGIPVDPFDYLAAR